MEGIMKSYQVFKIKLSIYSIAEKGFKLELV